MRYFLGVHGDVTKTMAVIGNEQGLILGSGLSGPANCRVVGIEGAIEAIRAAAGKALAKAGLLGADSVRSAVLGLPVGNLPAETDRLHDACQRILGSVPFRVVHDCWIALRGGARDEWGVAVLGNHRVTIAGRGPLGEECLLRGGSYQLGSFGGGCDMIQEALHHAFRSEEGTGPSTALEREIPRVMGLPSMKLVADLITAGRMNAQTAPAVVPLVFQLAQSGDRVAQEILIALGDAMGQAAGGVARRLGIHELAFDVVLAGSIWHGASPLLRDQFTTAVHRVAPRAQPQLPLFEPAVGAYLMALEDAGERVTPETGECLVQTASDL